MPESWVFVPFPDLTASKVWLPGPISSDLGSCPRTRFSSGSTRPPLTPSTSSFCPATAGTREFPQTPPLSRLGEIFRASSSRSGSTSKTWKSVTAFGRLCRLRPMGVSRNMLCYLLIRWPFQFRLDPRLLKEGCAPIVRDRSMTHLKIDQLCWFLMVRNHLGQLFIEKIFYLTQSYLKRSSLIG